MADEGLQQPVKHDLGQFAVDPHLAPKKLEHGALLGEGVEQELAIIAGLRTAGASLEYSRFRAGSCAVSSAGSRSWRAVRR